MAKSERRRRRVPDDAPTAASSLRDIESSALVAALLEQGAEVLTELRELGRRVTSALTFTAAARAAAARQRHPTDYARREAFGPESSNRPW